MARHFRYNCTKCGKRPCENDLEARAALTAVVVSFKEVGYRGKVWRSRVVDWLCPECLKQHPNFDTADRSFIEKVAADG